MGSNSTNVSMSTSNQVPNINGCGIGTTYIFFMVYILLTFFLLVNLFIAVIVEAFGTADSMYSRMVRLEEADVDSPTQFKHLARHGALISRLEYERFCYVWNKIDIRGLLFVDMKKVPQLMRKS